MKNKNIIIYIVIFFVLYTVSPMLAFIALIWFAIFRIRKENKQKASKYKDYHYSYEAKERAETIKKQQGLDRSMKMHKDNSYDVNKKSDYHGVSRENRDRSYTTRELYAEIASHKTDYRGVNKDLL